MDTTYTGKVFGFLFCFAKAFVVAYWYMHLKEENKWLKFIAAIPISAFIYAVVVILEST